LTGSSSGLALTLAFPAPFPLTLTGAVNLLTNSTTFTGLPDIPLTNLRVSLSGGGQGLFLSTCRTPSGTATATLTDQNADRSLTVPSAFTVLGCPSTGAASGQPGTTGAGTTSGGVTSAGTALGAATLSGLKGHAPSRTKKHKRKRRSRHHRRHR
jgi:hypothetical protein